MKIKLLKKIRKNFKIVEYKEWVDYFGECWGDFFQIEYKGDSFVPTLKDTRFYYDTSYPKKHPKNSTREEAFLKAYSTLVQIINTKYANKKHYIKKRKISPEKVLWPPEESGWWIKEEGV